MLGIAPLLAGQTLRLGILAYCVLYTQQRFLSSTDYKYSIDCLGIEFGQMVLLGKALYSCGQRIGACCQAIPTPQGSFPADDALSQCE